jgi:hypothetical protein
MIGRMHLIVAFANAMSESAKAALADLSLPHLARLLARSAIVDRDDAGGSEAPELTLNAPHERALAAACGVPPAPDGLVPMAALLALRPGASAPPIEGPLALLTPAHWVVGTDQVSVLDPASLGLDEAEGRVVFDAVRGLFESEGFALHHEAPLRWWAGHPGLADVPTASLDRVVGRNVDRWLQGGARAESALLRLVRRLQNEVQMLLYTHPLNAEREARGALVVNSVWLSGTGALPAGVRWPEGLVFDDRLRAPALADDGFAWSRAWAELDAGPIAALPTAARLTLCGERGAVTLGPRGGWLESVKALIARPDPRALLASL